MKIFYFVFALALVAGLCATTRAQVCGGFYVKLSIHDEDSRPVKTSSIAIVPLVKDELNGKKFEVADGPSGTAEMKLLEGQVILEKYKLVISAPGFADTEKIVQFPHCKRIWYDVLMLRPGVKRTRVSGQVTSENEPQLYGSHVIFTGADKVERATESDFEGNYEIKLIPGEYAVTVKATNHDPYQLDRFIVPSDGEAQLDVRLQTTEVSSVPSFLQIDPAAPLPAGFSLLSALRGDLPRR
ncbi:MAG: carboxypeptidase-like regulatory domain-containing protein [Pyrinomonadaceae bacterium]